MFGSKYIPFEAHEHRGYRYDVMEDREDDNRKYFHEAHGHGQVLSLDHSPYTYLTKEKFVELVNKALEGK